MFKSALTIAGRRFFNLRLIDFLSSKVKRINNLKIGREGEQKFGNQYGHRNDFAQALGRTTYPFGAMPVPKLDESADQANWSELRRLLKPIRVDAVYIIYAPVRFLSAAAIWTG